MKQQEGPIVLIPDGILEHIASFMKHDIFSSFAPISHRFMSIGNNSVLWSLNEGEERVFAGTKLTPHQKYIQAMFLAAPTKAKSWVRNGLIVEKRGAYYQCGTTYMKVRVCETPRQLLMYEKPPCLLVKNGEIRAAVITLGEASTGSYDPRAYEVLACKTANPSHDKVLKMLREGNNYTLFKDGSWISDCASSCGLLVCNAVNALSLEDTISILGRKDPYFGEPDTTWLFALFKQGEPFVTIIVTYEHSKEAGLVSKVEVCGLKVYEVAEVPSVLGFHCPFEEYRRMSNTQAQLTEEMMSHCLITGTEAEAWSLRVRKETVSYIAKCYRNGWGDYC